MSQYVDFRINVGASVGDKRYALNATSADGTESSGEIIIPTDEVYNQFMTLKTYSSSSITEDQAIAFGQILYNALLKDDVKAAFVNARNNAARDGNNLRIKLAIPPQAAEVAGIPWEFACDDVGRPLATKHSICRFLPRLDPVPAFKVSSGEKITVLLISSAPTDLDAKLGYSLNVEQELESIKATLKPLQDQGVLKVIEIPHVTGSKLQMALSDENPHIVHYVGHGGFADGAGQLAFEDNNGNAKNFSARQLAIAFDGTRVRLVILNACQTGMVVTKLLSSMAPALMGANVPAVIAMQDSVTDAAGGVLAREFYRSLAKNLPIDECVARARRMVIAEGINNLDWGLATLYMRAPDGMLFSGLGDTASTQAQPAPQSTPQPAQQPVQQGGNTINNMFGSGNTFSGSNISIGNVTAGNVNQSVNNANSVNSSSQNDDERQQDLQRLRDKRKQLKDSLHVLEMQEARFGINVPVHIALEIQDTKKKIADLEKQIKELGG